MTHDFPEFLSNNRQILFRLFFFAGFVFLLYQLLRILSPFFSPLLMAVTFTLIFYPFHTWVSRHLKKRTTLAAALSTIALLTIVIIPLLFFVWLLIRESAVVYHAGPEWIRNLKNDHGASLDSTIPASVKELWAKAERTLSTWGIDPQDIFLKNINQIGKHISTFGTTMVKNMTFLIFNGVVMVFALFFFLRDGEKIVRKIVDLIPMELSHKELILLRLDQTLCAIVRGVFITAAVQGLLAGLGYAVAGLRFSALLGFVTAFSALIPFVGAAAVWIPASLYLFLKGAVLKGAILALWGILVVSLIDNFLKPILIGDKAKIPTFLLFFALLGGIRVYGFIGILVGPLVITAVLAFIKIYKEQLGLSPYPAQTGKS